MSKIGIILDSMIDQLKSENIFKDASNVSLSFINTEALSDVTKTSSLSLNKQSNLKEYIHEITSFVDKGFEHILIITSSQDMTKSYEKALLAKDILKNVAFDIMDSKTFGPGILYLLMCIKLWQRKNYGYNKIKELLKLQIDKGSTWIVTREDKFGLNSPKVKKLLKPFIKAYVLNSHHNYQVEQVIYNDKKIMDILYQQILGYKGFNNQVNIFVYSGLNGAKAKLLQHELYTKNKDLNINLYSVIPKELSDYFGDDVYGIYLGYYEEATL